VVLTISEKALRYLSQSPILRDVGVEELSALDPPPEVIHLRAGETLFRQGAEDADYFVLITGRLSVFRHGESGQWMRIGRILPGEGVGEMALLTNEPRSATVIARLDSELVRFGQSTFLALLERHPSSVLSIARSIIQRANVSTGHKRPAYPIIAILSLSPGADAAALARGLAEQLQTYGSTCHVDEAAAGDLDNLEQQFDFIICAAGPQATGWSRYCLARADYILLAADVLEPAAGEVETELLSNLKRELTGRIDLLLVHPGRWHAHCGAMTWLTRLNPTEHHHLRSGNDSDLARLGRIIVGSANNLALSGGGARALAHIGVLRAFAECGIPIDRIGGTSMGAIIGALFALDHGFDEAVKQMRELFWKRKPTKDYTIPILSLLAGKRMDSIGRDLFGSWTIEDLPIRYFCVSSDLGEGKVVEHFDGPVWMALRATSAIPVIAPPLLTGTQVLVDGGVLNNLPIDLMQDHFSGKFFAIDVSKYHPIAVDNRWNLMCPSGFELLRARLHPFRPKPQMPSIVEMLLRTITLASEGQSRRAREKANLLLTPPVEMYPLLNFNDFDAIVEKGYRYTISALEQLDKDRKFQ
jgi:NTE family protein